MIPEIIENGKNGFISNDENELRDYIRMLLEDDKLRQTLGNEARKTITENYNIDRFASDWNKLFNKVIEEVS